MSRSDYLSASPELLAEIVREAEVRLQAQLTGAVAADQRAMTFTGLLLAAAGALIGAALASAARGAELAGPIFVTAVGLVLAAILAVISARPVDWDYSGNTPGGWVKHIADGHDLNQGLAAMADHYADMIEANEKVIASNAAWIRASMGMALLSVSIGLVYAAIELF